MSDHLVPRKSIDILLADASNGLNSGAGVQADGTRIDA
jgi:hypothetical protein